MAFLNRKKEIKLIKETLERKKPAFIVIYGRRRCGKSTLIQNVLKKDDVYFLADQSEATLQRKMFSESIAKIIPGFSDVYYPEWNSLFTNLNNIISKSKEVNKKTNIYIDEFPYLVKTSPELPSVLQKQIDLNKESKINLIICGSSQQMMHSIAIERTSPLYGRSDLILKVEPMGIEFIKEFLKCEAEQAVEEYSVFGGIPRYWELRKNYYSLEEAIKKIILDRNGILYDEPASLFRDEIRTHYQAHTLLSVIAQGASRVSEIASRMNKDATQLSNPLNLLMELGYIKREIPFSEKIKNTKKTLYRIEDNFINFYYKYLVPNKSEIEVGLTDIVFEKIKNTLPGFYSGVWEDVVRKKVSGLKLFGIQWTLASRYWETLKNSEMEIDLMAESVDKKSILIGEIKWSENINAEAELKRLIKKSEKLQFRKNYNIKYALFLKHCKEKKEFVFTPDDLIF